jgi:NDP-sugar pyrophosphorylase family protein
MSGLNLIIPAAGLGSRFRNVGVSTPKPLISVLGMPMLEWVIGNFPLQPGDSVTVIGQKSEALEEHVNLDLISRGVDLQFVAIDGLTEGPAITVTKAFPFIDMKKPLIVANSDQYVSANLQSFIDLVRRKIYDGLILSMEAHGNKWSYVGRDKSGGIVEVQEKKEISDEATVGVYAWSSGDFCQQGILDLISAGDRVNNEFYVAPTFNYLIKSGLKIETMHIGAHGEQVHGLGTPEDLNTFLENPEILNYKDQVIRNLCP